MVNKKKIAYMSVKTPIQMDAIFPFLEAQTLYPKFYWENREDGKIGGIGSAIELDHFPIFESEEGPSFFGGFDFMKRLRKTWDHFPETLYFLPLLEIRKVQDETFLYVNRIQEHVDLDLSLKEVVSCDHRIALIDRLDSPPFSLWEDHVNACLEKIERKEYAKVVLARCTQLTFQATLPLDMIFKNLEGENRFFFQFCPKKAFIGASPETLYRRKKNQIESVALAGTCSRGKGKQEDRFLMDTLLQDPKENYECQIVKNEIYDILFPFCKTLDVEKQTILKTPYVQHLYHTFRGKLKDGISDRELIQALHPTPAVGGFPKKKALEEIREKEMFDRGWYAAPIGFISPLQSHHLVGIRSALVAGNYLYLFAGTGIVKGSTSSKEWEELEEKIQHYKVFYGRNRNP